MDIIAKVVKTFETGAVKAVCDVTLDNAIVIHGVKLVKGQKGDFVSMPSDSWKNKNGEVQHSDIAHPLDVSTRSALFQAVSDAYQNHVHPMTRNQSNADFPFGW